jgi:hypothetical protein
LEIAKDVSRGGGRRILSAPCKATLSSGVIRAC